MRRPRFFFWLFCSLALCSSIPAQLAWTRTNGLRVEARYVSTWDSVRQRVVAIGLSPPSAPTTLEWNGVRWVQKSSTAALPQLGILPALAYDAARAETIAFGGGTSTALGASSTPINETWTWDGVDWRQVQPAASPAPRVGHAMTYDPVRQRVVLFGGRDLTQTFGDTWEWDGVNWQRRQPTTSPSMRRSSQMSWDPVGQRVLLVSGVSATRVDLDETWAWDGANWTRLTPTQRPPSGSSLRIATDFARNVVLAYDRRDVYAWNGSDWSIITTANRPQGWVGDIFYAFDGNRGGVIAGFDLDVRRIAYGETMCFDGTDWTFANQIPRAGGELVADVGRNRVVMFGGSTAAGRSTTELFEWDGQRWEARDASPSPARRLEGHRMAFDRSRQRSVLFGGYRGTSSNATNETWEWDGSAWTLMQPSTAPSPRHGRGMAYDAARRETVLFGGVVPGPPYGSVSVFDTWTWDGVDWTQRNPATTPTDVSPIDMLWDARRQLVVMIGRNWATGGCYETWEWDGVDWSRVTTANTPQSRFGGRAAYEPARDLVVFFASDLLTWTYDGVDWTLEPVPVPIGLSNSGLLDIEFDPTRGRIMGFQRDDGATWILGPEVSAAASRFGSGCAGSAGVPVLSPSGVPSVAGPEFVVELTSARPNAAAILAFAPFVVGGGGAPFGGCTLFAFGSGGFIGSLGVTSAGGFAEQTLPISVGSGLFGASLDCQGLVLDSNGAGLGVVAATAGLRLTIGY